MNLFLKRIKKNKNKLDRYRLDFYRAESIRESLKDTKLEAEVGVFKELEDDTYNGIIDKVEEDYPTNCASAKGFAREVIKLRKRYLHSCRLKELIQEITKAINSYDEGPNFELISAEEERNSKKRAAFWEKVKAVGREIF